jgi:hypothetical protein
MTPQQDALLHELADRPVTCSAGDDCEEKWNRAIGWVSTHSHTGIKSIDDDLIATNTIDLRQTSPGLRYPEFTIVRHRVGRDRYEFDFTSFCDYGVPCDPSALKYRASFVTWVMGPTPGVKVTPDGNSASKVIY